MKLIYLLSLTLGFGFTHNPSAVAETHAEIGIVTAHIGDSGGALIHRGNAALAIETGNVLLQHDIVTTGPESSLIVKTSECEITISPNSYFELEHASLCASPKLASNLLSDGVDQPPSKSKTTPLLTFDLQDASKSSTAKTRAVGSS